MKLTPFRRQSRKGSILLVSVLLSTGLALSLGSFIMLSVNASNAANRSFYLNSSLNFAEAGLEEGLYAVNNDVWTGWTGTTQKKLVLTTYDLGQGTTGTGKVLVDYSSGLQTPTITAEGRTSPRFGSAIVKQIQVKIGRRSHFATGLVAKSAMTFSGNNVAVDSWNSDPDNNPATTAIPYSSAVKNDKGTVGSLAVTITIGNADIWGYAATGGSDPAVGPNGTVASFGNSQGTIDHSRITHDFTANFDTPTVPAYSSINTIAATINGPTSLPAAGDVYDMVNGQRVYYYRVPGVNLSGASSNVLTIGSYNVVLLPTAGSGASAISLTGNSSIAIATGASLAVYTQGNISIAGNGVTSGGNSVATANQPISLQVYGTNTTPGGQSIAIAGNGVLSGVVYAPNASLSIKGGGSSGDVLGSFVANTVNMTGNDAFHYDESLLHFGPGNPFAVSSWIELVHRADRVNF